MARTGGRGARLERASASPSPSPPSRKGRTGRGTGEDWRRTWSACDWAAVASAPSGGRGWGTHTCSHALPTPLRQAHWRRHFSDGTTPCLCCSAAPLLLLLPSWCECEQAAGTEYLLQPPSGSWCCVSASVACFHWHPFSSGRSKARWTGRLVAYHCNWAVFNDLFRRAIIHGSGQRSCLPCYTVKLAQEKRSRLHISKMPLRSANQHISADGKQYHV